MEKSAGGQLQTIQTDATWTEQETGDNVMDLKDRLKWLEFTVPKLSITRRWGNRFRDAGFSIMMKISVSEPG